MTLTLEIPSELGAQIERAAQKQGIDVASFLIEAAQRALDPDVALDALLNTLVGESTPGELAEFDDEVL